MVDLVSYLGTKRFALEVARAKVSGAAIVRVIGHNLDVDTGTAEDVWDEGGDLNFLTVAATLEAISTDTNDTSAGSGAQKVKVSGLDASFNEISEVITMAGTSASSATSASFIRVNKFGTEEVGTYGTMNAGDITLRVSSAGSTQAKITADRGRAMSSLYTIPNAKVGYLASFAVGAQAAKPAAFRLMCRVKADDVSSPFTGVTIVMRMYHGVEAVVIQDLSVPQRIPSKSDIWVRCEVDANNTKISSAFELIIIDD